MRVYILLPFPYVSTSKASAKVTCKLKLMPMMKFGEETICEMVRFEFVFFPCRLLFESAVESRQMNVRSKY